MTRLSTILLILIVIAGAIAFGGLAPSAAGIARICFFVLLLPFVISLFQTPPVPRPDE